MQNKDVVTLTVSIQTNIVLKALAFALDLLDEEGEPDVAALLDALAAGRILLRMPPDPPIGVARWIATD